MATVKTLPRLKADNQTLFELYHNHMLIDTADIKNTFNVSGQTAIKVVNRVKEHMTDTVDGYVKPIKHIVPVKQLFDLYGWDIKQINSSVKTLRKDG